MMLEVYFTSREKKLKYGDYEKSFDVNDIDELLSKIKDKSISPIKIYASENDIVVHQLKHPDGGFLYEAVKEVPIFDENIINEDLTNIKLKKYTPKKEWQLQFGDVVYITNSKQMQRRIVDKQSKFCFTNEDIKELQKNNWQIDNAYMIRVFFDGNYLLTN